MLVSLNEHNLLGLSSKNHASTTDMNNADTFLPFHLEFACSASSALIMVDDVLRGKGVPASAKALIPRVLNDIAQSGNAVAPWRLKELEQVTHLSKRLWINDTARNHLPTPQAVTQEAHSTGPMRDHDDEAAAQNPSPADDVATNLLLQEDVSFLAPLSTTSSSDFAHAFDFSQAQMLFLADQLEDDNLPSMLEFGDSGLNEWI